MLITIHSMNSVSGGNTCQRSPSFVVLTRVNIIANNMAPMNVMLIMRGLEKLGKNPISSGSRLLVFFIPGERQFVQVLVYSIAS